MSADQRNDDQEMSMEEILASIRRYVSDETPETNLKEASVEYNSGKTADVIRLTEIIDSQEVIIDSKNPNDHKPNDVSEKSAQQTREETYAQENPKVQHPYQQPFQQRQNVKPTQPHSPYEKLEQQPQYAPPSVQSTYNRRDPMEAYGEQKLPYRSVDGSYTNPTLPLTQNNYAQQQGYYAQQQPQSREYSQQHNKYPPSYDMPKPTIVSEPTLSATEQALSKLTQAFQFAHQEQKHAEEKSAVYGTSAIESFVIEMARPMIREWIDKHLPKLVDRLVTQEIEKLTEELRKKLL